MGEIIAALPRWHAIGRHIARLRRASPRAVLDGWIAAESGRFLPWLAVAMAAGITLYFAQEAEPPALLGPLLAVAAVALLLPLRRHLLGRGLALTVAALALGFAVASQRTRALPPMPDLPRHAVLLSGRVRAVEPLPTGRRLVLEAVTLDGGAPMSRRLRVRLRREDLQPLAPGDRIAVKALLRPPYAPSYPGGWDLRRDQFYQGLGGGGFALGRARLLGGGHAGGLAGRWQSLREGIAGRIAAAIPGAPGAVAATLLTGIASGIPAQDRADFATAGLAHILAVAGLHIGIVMSTIFAATRWALTRSQWVTLRWPVKQIAGVAALAVGALYMLITGIHLPIIRSFTMALLVTLGLLLGRRAISMRSLAIAATFIMLTQPEAVVGVSFQMSFGAVMVLIAGYESLRRRRLDFLARREGLIGWLRHDLTLVSITSLLASAATAPFVAYHFGQAQPYSVPANLIAVPLTAFWLLPLGLLGLALMPLHLGWLGLVPMGWGCALMVRLVHLVARLPAGVIAVPPIPPAGLAAAVLGLAWLCLWQSRLRLLGLAPLAVFCLLPFAGARQDILVSPDLRMIAFIAPRVVYLEQAGRDDFTLGEWHRFFGSRPVRPLPETGASPDGRALCTADGCLLRGLSTVLLWRAEDAPQQCDGFAAIVTAGWLDRDDLPSSCRAIPVITVPVMRAAGATIIRLERDGAHLRQDRVARGDWPWLPPMVP